MRAFCSLSCSRHSTLTIFFFNDTATTEIYTLSLHDALPISSPRAGSSSRSQATAASSWRCAASPAIRWTELPETPRSEEHTSELQSPDHLVCRLLLEKKKTQQTHNARRISVRCPAPRTSTYR